MKNVRFLTKELKNRGIDYKEIQVSENKSPCYWVDLKIIFDDDEMIIRLPAYNKNDYSKNNYEDMIKNRLNDIK